MIKLMHENKVLIKKYKFLKMKNLSYDVNTNGEK